MKNRHWKLLHYTAPTLVMGQLGKNFSQIQGVANNNMFTVMRRNNVLGIATWSVAISNYKVCIYDVAP